MNENEKCHYEDCNEMAVGLACGREHFDPLPYCSKHRDMVADEGSPEYHGCCPNCGCLFPIN